MSFKSKAKSPSEVHEICLNNCKAHDCSKCQFVSWVPLKAAEKRIESLMTEDEKLFTGSYAKLIDFETRIAKANKILDLAELVPSGYKIQGEDWRALRDLLKQPNAILAFLALQKFNSEKSKHENTGL